jgi:hypothetical protein
MSKYIAGRYHSWLTYRPAKDCSPITISYSFEIVDGSGESLDAWFCQVPIVPYFYPARILETGTNLFWARVREMHHLRLKNMCKVDFTIYSNGEFIQLTKFNKYMNFIAEGSIINIGISAKYIGEVNKWRQWYCKPPAISIILQHQCPPNLATDNGSTDSVPASIDDPATNERPTSGHIAVKTTSVVAVSSAKQKFDEYASKFLHNF